MPTDLDLLAEALPRYEIGREIGRGGWGIVFEGRHRDLDRAVAIKQLPRAFGADPSVRDRFVAEARLVASLEHPHIVPVYDFVERDGLYVIVMELATGGTLWQRFSETGLETDEAVAAVMATAVGLHHAHSRGLLHRDVKPDNVLYSDAGTVKIADFGIAKAMGDTQAGRTATGLVIGTPAYMAPEQVTGGTLSAATDVYALAVVLYELLSGRLPFPKVTDGVAQLFQHVHDEPRALAEVRPEVPASLAKVVHHTLAKNPADRPASAEEFAIELATAATSAFGPGWLARSGLHVMGSTRVVAATERATGELDRLASTVLVRPEQLERLRLGGLQSEVASEDAIERSRRAENSPGSTAPQRPVVDSSPSSARTVASAGSGEVAEEGRGPVVSDTATHAASPEPLDGGPPRPAPARRRGALPVLLATSVAVIATVFVAIFALGGDDPSAANSEAEATGLAISVSETEAFRGICESNGVEAGLCACALERGIEQLDVATFRSSLASMLEGDGVLSDEFAGVFQSCVDEGI